MLSVRTDGLELLPDTAETIWVVVSVLLVVTLVLLVVGLVVRANRAGQRRRGPLAAWETITRRPRTSTEATQRERP